MNHAIEFEVPRVPITINRLSREHWSKRVAAKKLWMEELNVALHGSAMKTLREWAASGEKIRIELHVLHARSFDPDNLLSAAKIPLDSLKALGCIADDSAKYVELSVTQGHSKRKAAQFRIAKIDPKLSAPYPWCIGNPTVEACVERGFCSRDPNCGE